MLKIEEIIIRLSEAGVQVYLEEGKLKTRSINQGITPGLATIIRGNKDRLIKYLTSSGRDSLSQDKERFTIKPTSRDSTTIPLSFAQERLWFIDRLEGGSPEYNMPTTLPISGEFNVDAAEQAFNRIVQRHEPLRTVFTEREDEPIQIIRENVTFKLVRYNLSNLNEKKQTARANELITLERQKVFDLGRDLMLRGIYLDLSDDADNLKGVLIFTMHHIASDGWSMDIVSKEFSTQYQAILAGKPDPLAPLEIQYADYAQWQRKWMAGEVLESQLAYWLEKLADLPAVHSLPLDFARPATKRHDGAMVSESLSTELSRRLTKLARQHEVTAYMLLHASLGLVLSRHSYTHDIVLGTPVANRMQVELKPLIGFFVNTLVLRTCTDYEKFSDYINHVKEVNLDAQANQGMPFESLVEHCRPPRSTQYSPLFQIMFSMNTNESAENGSNNKRSSGVHYSANVVARFDLTINASLTETGGYLSWVYDSSLFTQIHIETLNAHLQRLLMGIVEKPGALIKDLPMLSDKEIRRLTRELNDTQSDYPKNKLVHELFEAQARQNPNKIALVYETGQLSYGELNRRSNQLAHCLIAQGVGPEVLVGVCVERSLEMVIGLLGILKAGGCYVPLDPNYPKKRLGYLIDDSGVSLIVSQAAVQASLGLNQILQEEVGQVGPQREIRCILIDKVDRETEYAQNNPVVPLHPSNLVYVIYTSGSTGKPKGVRIAHRNVTNFLSSMQQKPAITIQDKLLAVTTLSFDIAVLELFLPLIAGASVDIASDDCKVSGHEIAARIEKNQITLLQATPVTWRLLLESDWRGKAGLSALVGGEAFPQALAEELFPKVKTLWNMYGPTETTVWSLQKQVSASTGSVSIGKPINNTDVYVLDRHQALCPIGVPGELYLGGDGLSLGYFHRAGLTASRFVPHPFSQTPGMSLYKTGDLVRYLPDGNIDFIGRVDQQVKLRGFRIELGEIENVLLQHLKVKEVVVLIKGEEPDNQRLVAYVVCKGRQDDEELAGDESNQALSEPNILINELLAQAQAQLPMYMVPSVVVILESLPLTANGKVDRGALPAPDMLNRQVKYQAPVTETELVLTEIWSKILQVPVEAIGIQDSFFNLGGHSLLAIKLLSQVNTRLETNIMLSDIFRMQEIVKLAAYIDELNSGELDDQLAIKRTGQLPGEVEEEDIEEFDL